MRKIILIVTDGCTACKIMRRLICEALRNTVKEIEFEVQNRKQADKVMMIHHDITDFPATVLIKDDVVKYVIIGTTAAAAINRYIDVYLK